MARKPRTNRTEARMVRALDQLAEFEKFQEEILPILSQAIKEGWTAEKIYGHPKAQALLAARQLSIGIMDPDAGKALSAIKDVMDRAHGKATERQEIKHQLEKLGDNELDALLQTALTESGPAASDPETLN